MLKGNNKMPKRRYWRGVIIVNFEQEHSKLNFHLGKKSCRNMMQNTDFISCTHDFHIPTIFDPALF